MQKVMTATTAPGELADGPRRHLGAAAQPAPQQNRHAHRQADHGLTEQRPVKLTFLLLAIVLGPGRVTYRRRVIAHRLDRAHQIVRVDPAADPRAAVGEIHPRDADAGYALQGAFDGAHARRAVGAGDRQVRILLQRHRLGFAVP